MATNQLKIEYNGLAIEPSGSYTITKIEGLTGLPIRANDSIRTAAHGGIYYNSFYGIRSIIIEGRILTDNPNDFFTAQDNLLKAFKIENDLKELKIKLWNGKERYIECYVSETPMIAYKGGEPTTAAYRIELKAPNPFFYEAAKTAELYIASNEGGTPIRQGIPIPTPISYNANNKAIITNTGDIEEYPIIRIYGKTKNPTINILTASGAFYFGINDIIETNNVVTIQVANGNLLVTKNSLNFLPAFFGEFKKLDIGANTIIYTAQTADPTSKVVVEFRDRYYTITS